MIRYSNFGLRPRQRHFIKMLPSRFSKLIQASYNVSKRVQFTYISYNYSIGGALFNNNNIKKRILSTRISKVPEKKKRGFCVENR